MTWFAVIAAGGALLTSGCGDTSLHGSPSSAGAPSVSPTGESVSVHEKSPDQSAKPQAASGADKQVEPKTAGTAPVASSANTDKKPAALRPLPPGVIRDITFDTIKFDMKKEDPFQRSMLTPLIEALDGSRVRIRGFIYPPPQKKGLKRFVLVRDNMSCCFGPGAALYDSITVDMKDDQTIDYTVAPVAVEGTFTIKVVSIPEINKVLSIYHLTAEKVK